MADDVSTGSVEDNQDLLNQGRIINKLMDGCEENEFNDEEQEFPYVRMETFNKDFFIRHISVVIAKAQQQLWLKGKREIATIKNNI